VVAVGYFFEMTLSRVSIMKIRIRGRKPQAMMSWM